MKNDCVAVGVATSSISDRVPKTFLLLAGIYIFISVNDLVLLAFDALWIKSLILFFLLVITPLLIRMFRVRLLLFYNSLFIVSLFWLLISIGYGNNTDFILPHLFSLLVTLLAPAIIITLCAGNLKSINYLVRWFLFAIVFASIYKLIYVLFAAGLLSGSFLNSLFEGVSGRGELGGVYRSNTGNQLLVSLAIFIVIRLLLLGYKRGYMVILAIIFFLNTYLAASVFFTFTTLFMVGCLLSLHFFKKASFGAIILMLAVVGASIYLVWDMMVSRLGVVDGGNEIRLTQSQAILEQFFSAPVFGSGLGFYIESFVRSEATPFVYENQLFSLFMHLGIFGVAAYFIYVLTPFVWFRRCISLRYLLAFLGYVCVASIFNPYLVGTYAAVSFVALYFLAVLFGPAFKLR